MNHKKIKKQINKVNSFFESITDDDEISKIEKDLLLSYVRKLYESILNQDDSAPTKPRKEAKQSKVSNKKVEKETPASEKEPQPEAKRKPFERAEKVQPDVQEVVATPVEAIIQEAAIAVAPAETVAVATTVVTEKTVAVSEKMESIFERSGVTEISDRLGNLPLKDLTKAMGINERMFTIKELFGGDQNKFKTVMSDINKLSGYDEAKEYLISGVATEMEWDSENNYKKADKFVKLVQRRFS